MIVSRRVKSDAKPKKESIVIPQIRESGGYIGLTPSVLLEHLLLPLLHEGLVELVLLGDFLV